MGLKDQSPQPVTICPGKGKTKEGFHLLCNQHIIIIDDDLELLSLLNDFLNRKAAKISTFNNPQEGLTFVKNHLTTKTPQPIILILDVNMPRVNGFKILEQLCSRNISVPTILISSFGDTTLKRMALKKGAHAFMPKPFSLLEFKQTLCAIAKNQI